MVSNPGRTPDPRRIRRLKPAEVIEVQVDAEGLPLRIRLGRWCDISLIRHPWRIDQHWWRAEAISRLYYRVAPEDGPPLTIYRDLVGGDWFRQEYM